MSTMFFFQIAHGAGIQTLASMRFNYFQIFSKLKKDLPALKTFLINRNSNMYNCLTMFS
jgi:hypothetical protein